jgi:hypothetical protein
MIFRAIYAVERNVVHVTDLFHREENTSDATRTTWKLPDSLVMVSNVYIVMNVYEDIDGVRVAGVFPKIGDRDHSVQRPQPNADHSDNGRTLYSR